MTSPNSELDGSRHVVRHELLVAAGAHLLRRLLGHGAEVLQEALKRRGRGAHRCGEVRRRSALDGAAPVYAVGLEVRYKGWYRDM